VHACVRVWRERERGGREEGERERERERERESFEDIENILRNLTRCGEFTAR